MTTYQKMDFCQWLLSYIIDWTSILINRINIMNKRDIIQAGNPLLKQRSSEVTHKDILNPKVQSIIDDMLVTMKAYQGVGLAAPQIGINLRIMCYGFDHNPRYPKALPVPLTIFINPVIVTHSEDIQIGFEGCLSVLPLRGEVPRYQWLEVKGYDREGNEILKRAEGFEARIIQHELDHLDGMLFVERIQDFKHFGFTEVLKAHKIIP